MAGFGFDFKSDINTVQYGFIAQDVRNVLPQYVVTGQDGYYQMDYSHFIGIMFKATKEQNAEIKLLKDQLASLQTTVNALKTKVDAL